MPEVHPRSGHCQKAMAAVVFEASGDTIGRLGLRRHEAPGLERILRARAGSEKRLDRPPGDCKGVASETPIAVELWTMMRAAASRENGSREGWMRVLGIDPAAAGPTGYGIVEGDGRQCRVLHYGALKVRSSQIKNCEGAALEEVHTLLCKLIEEFAPDVMAVESIFSALNVRTALRLAEVRGVVLLAAAQHGVEVHSYAPREVKANIAGRGQADKRQIQIMVRAMLSLDAVPEPPDAADALAVALCHLQTEHARRCFRLPLEANTHSAGRGTSIRMGRATVAGRRAS